MAGTISQLQGSALESVEDASDEVRLSELVPGHVYAETDLRMKVTWLEGDRMRVDRCQLVRVDLLNALYVRSRGFPEESMAVTIRT